MSLTHNTSLVYIMTMNLTQIIDTNLKSLEKEAQQAWLKREIQLGLNSESVELSLEETLEYFSARKAAEKNN